MPVYMDRHEFSGVTADGIAAAHQLDLQIQDKFGCKALTYWFDELRQTAFCLIEGPDIEAVNKMHDYAHGMVATEIIEVAPHILQAFLGRMHHPEGAGHAGSSEGHAFEDSALRTLLTTEWIDADFIPLTCSRSDLDRLSAFHHATIRQTLTKWEGKEVPHMGKGFLASFASATKALNCALEIQQAFKKYSNWQSTEVLQLKIGICAGTPVDDSNQLFGKTIEQANRLRKITPAGEVTASAMVRDLYYGGESGAEVNESGAVRAVRIIQPEEERFLTQLFDTTEANWEEAGFTIHQMAKHLGVSKSQLYRKTTALTGLSPNDFIKEFRLSKSIQLIEKQEGKVAEIAYKAGFSSPSYFTKCFKQRFNILPSAYATAIADASLS
jgi:AraC-like DNA-binding protein